MTSYVALLRAVNVGGTGKLPMAELREMAERCGFGAVRTYIASGNLLFETDQAEPELKARLASALDAYAGKLVGVFVRAASELAAVLAANPFPEADPSRTVAIFLDSPGHLEGVRGQAGERLGLGGREIYVHYGDGMRDSRLVIPAARAGTARNMATVAKLATMAGR